MTSPCDLKKTVLHKIFYCFKPAGTRLRKPCVEIWHQVKIFCKAVVELLSPLNLVSYLFLLYTSSSPRIVSLDCTVSRLGQSQIDSVTLTVLGTTVECQFDILVLRIIRSYIYIPSIFSGPSHQNHYKISL